MIESGILFTPPEPAAMAALARASEEAGFALLGLGDSQSLFREAYVSLTVSGLATSRIRLMPAVSNIVTRHLAVTASAIASLDEATDGRAILGLGTGDSAVLNLSERPVKLADLERAVMAVRGLLRGETVDYLGRSVHVRWCRREVPIFVSAEGPRMLRLAGRIADGVIVGTGLLPEVIASSLAAIEEGAAEAGRDLSEIEVWFFAKANIADSGADAVAEIRMALAASANHSFRFTTAGKDLPEELRASIEELKKEYAFREHEDTAGSHNADLVDRLGLTAYLAKRFSVTGSPPEVAQRVSELEGMGVRRLLLAGITRDPLQFVHRWRSEVAPLMQRGAGASQRASSVQANP
ncbi:MAG: LLM class flavin-dependent oxidoreductase [Acidimicrobiales bacterium]